MTVCTLYFVRHAHSVWSNDEGRALSTAGHKSAERVAEVLRSYSIDAIYSSPYRRAIETVAPLASQLHLAIHRDKRLAERQLGDKHVSDFQQVVTQLWSHRNAALPGGESNVIAQKRGVEFIQSLLLQTADNQTFPRHCVVSTHGQIMALIMQHFYPYVDFVFWSKLSFPDIYMVSISDASAFSKGPANEYRDLTPGCSRSPLRLWSE